MTNIFDDEDAIDPAVAEAEFLRGTGRELEGYELVGHTLSKTPPRHTFTFRISAAELTEISLAARDQGQNLGDFIRSAALSKARSGTNTEDRRWLDKPVAEALDELVRRRPARV